MLLVTLKNRSKELEVGNLSTSVDVEEFEELVDKLLLEWDVTLLEGISELLEIERPISILVDGIEDILDGPSGLLNLLPENGDEFLGVLKNLVNIDRIEFFI